MHEQGWPVSVVEIGLAYGRQEVLVSVSLRVEPGELLGLVGPSGSGKTSLLSCIAGLVKPQRGIVKVGPHEISAMNRRRAAAVRGANIGQMFQDPELLPELSVAENVAVLEVFSGTNRAKALEAAGQQLEGVGLGGYGHRGTVELSGGEAQRVALARALSNPHLRLLLADEPTASLDVRTAGTVVDRFVGAVKQRGVTSIVCTHDPMVASKCDRVVELQPLPKAA